MQAIREIVTRDIFKNFDIPQEFGDEFEMILMPTAGIYQSNVKSTNLPNSNNAYLKFQEENGFSKNILTQESENIWNDI